MDMYVDELIAHYEHPHNKRKIAKCDATFHEYNPVCGDDITIYLNIDDGIIQDASFEGNGCSISVASASMLTDYIKKMSLENVQKMDFVALKEIIGIDPGPVRLKCATLALKTIKGAIFLYQKMPMDSATKKL